ncbi:MAG: hypothetical protein GX126_14200 [Bacteroidales bacterium]|nr:hypothetical protein [Bacteroidales bacterium]
MENSIKKFNYSRRHFIKTGSSTLAAMHLGVFNFASSLFDHTGNSGKPVVRVVYVRPDENRFFMGWPGADWDNPEHEKHYTSILNNAAIKLGVDLRINEKPLWGKSETKEFIGNVKNENPDGLLIVSFCLNPGGWPIIDSIAKERGSIPTVIFSPVGTSFTGHLQETRDIPGVFVGATQHEEWLGEGLRMLHTVWKMKNTRLLIVRGEEMREETVNNLGTTLCYYPESKLCPLAGEEAITDKVRAIADYYENLAKKIIEPDKNDILNAAKMYVTCRTLMEQENCDGISINCLPLVSAPIGSEKHIWQPCLAFSKLRDEGIVGGCEADIHAALSMRLCHLIAQRPGFMQDPAPLTVSNTLVGAHCSCGTRLRGFDQATEPFILRSHSEADRGVSTQVLWPVGEKVTFMELSDRTNYNKMRVGTGTVVSNIDPDPQSGDAYEEAGGCRTSVEVTVDNMSDTRDFKGFHQLFILGNVAQKFRNYGQLANIEVTDMSV